MTEKFVINDNAVSYPGGGGEGREREKRKQKYACRQREETRELYNFEEARYLYKRLEAIFTASKYNV